MNVKRSFLAGCLAAAGLIGACKKDDNQSLTDTDKNYMTQAAYSNLAEIDAGQLAATKGSKDSVKMYGTMMVADHQKAHASLDSMAKAKGFTLPTAPDAAHMATKQQLSALSGRAFDTTYINGQLTDHQKTITLFQSEIASGSNQNVRDFATKNLPVIQMHYTMADALRKKL